CDAHFDTRCAGAHRGRADTIDRQDRQRHRVRRWDCLARCEGMEQGVVTQSIEARLADEANQRCRKGSSPRGRLGEFLGPHDALLSLDERLISRADDRFATASATSSARETVTYNR